MLIVNLSFPIYMYLIICCYSTVLDERYRWYWISLLLYFISPMFISFNYMYFLITDYILQVVFLIILLVAFRNNIKRFVYISILLSITLLQIFTWVSFDFFPSGVLDNLILLPDRFYFEALLTLPITNRNKKIQIITALVSLLIIIFLYI